MNYMYLEQHRNRQNKYFFLQTAWSATSDKRSRTWNTHGMDEQTQMKVKNKPRPDPTHKTYTIQYCKHDVLASDSYRHNSGRDKHGTT